MSLKRGSVGADVRAVQKALNIKADGVFGAATEVAVKAFQKAHGLTPDGIVGPKTWAKLMPPVTLHDAQTRIERAKSVVKKGIKYDLGAGGYDPDSATPANKSGMCDCSGFISWCCGISRSPNENNTGLHLWISTDGIYADAKGKQIVFAEIPEPRPGCLVVYPDYIAKGKKREGHVGLLVDPTTWRGIDCSWSQSDDTGEAITFRSLAFFKSKAKTIFVVPRTEV